MPNYIAYEAVVHAARALALGLSPFSARIRRGVRARREALPAIERWSAERRERDRPLIWLHAPSVGESLMAQAISERLREAEPACQIAFTWFSPSAERIVHHVGADVTACLPWDVRGPIRRALDALAPDVVGFVRTEIWPVLVREARGRGIPTALVNAPLAQDSSRMRPLARRLLTPAYAMLDAVGAVGAPDAGRLAQLGAQRDRIEITGDARVDQVLDRLQRERRTPPFIERLREPATSVIVAGSTWPADEDRLLPAFLSVRETMPGPLRLILAPHQPGPAHLRRLEAALAGAGLRFVRLGAVERGAVLEDVVVVDRVGVLADLYRIADVAWVGGGFGEAGLHSILEPAALGVPVVYGPRFGNTVEAEALAGAGCGFVARDVRAVTDRLTALLHDEGRTGARAREWVEARRGGAAANATLLLRLMRERKGPGGH